MTAAGAVCPTIGSRPAARGRLRAASVDDSAAVVEVVGSAGGVEALGDRSAFAAVPLLPGCASPFVSSLPVLCANQRP